MKIRYGLWTEAWSGYSAFLEKLVSQRDVKRVVEIGGGANPALSLDFVNKHGLEYTVLDVSAEELAKAPEECIKIQADITSLNVGTHGRYDLVFSKMLAEHVLSGRDFHKNALSLLSEKGIAFHFFPTLYALPFVSNRLLPEKLAKRILHLLAERGDYYSRHAKFPAYYSWCRGPSVSQIKRFLSLGYRVEEYIGFFGHGYYSKIKPLQTVQEFLSAILVKHPFPWLTSYAYVVLSKQK